jgi:hypothetical protein
MKTERSECSRIKSYQQPMKGPEIPEWWAAIPEGEKTLLHAVARMLRSAKRSELQEVARAAAKWERGIGCFVKVRLITENRKAESRKLKWDSGWVRIEGKKSLESCVLSLESGKAVHGPESQGKS